MRFYRLLLLLYPAAFRNEYAAEMRHVFEQRRRHASGPIATFGLWLETLWDVLSNGARVHLDILRQDLSYTARMLRRAPGFALTAVGVTALGIGANTAVFSITDHVLIRPLPFPEPERLVKLYESSPAYRRFELSPPNYRDLRQRSTSFEAIAAYHMAAANLVGAGTPRRLEGTAITAELLPILGARPLIGRVFDAEDMAETAPATVLLSHRLWQQHFGGDDRVTGREVRLDDETYTVAGVMPPDFVFPRRETAYWVPMRLNPRDFEDRDNNYLYAVARIKPEITLKAARAEMDLIAARLAEEFPEANADTGVTVIPLRDELSRQARLLLWALLGAAICVLLIACLNLANLLLARAMARRRELIVRTAIGAGRERLIRQLLTESLVLALAGGILGVLVATAAVPLLSRLVPSSLPVGDVSVLDPRVLLFALLITAVTGVIFGVLPALRACRGARVAELMESSRSAVGDRRRRLRSALVIAEVAVSVVLLVGAGLLLRALWRVQAIDPGFRTEQVLTVSTPLPLPRYGPTEERAKLYQQVLHDVRALPEVQDAAYISFLPMNGMGGIWPVAIPDHTDDGSQQRASLRFVTPGFFDTLGIAIEDGRDVRDTDTDDKPWVAVVSRSFARRYWPDRDPIGRRFQFAFREREVVGVVEDIRFRGFERPSEPQVYLPNRQVPDGGIVFYAPRDLVIHTTAEPAALAAAVRRIVHRVDPELPVTGVRTMAEHVGRQTAPRRHQLRVLAAFAGLAVLLAGLGIHGLLSLAVSQRTAEIGLRMALGARHHDVLHMVLRQGIHLAIVGGTLGLAAAYAVGRSLEALLAGIQPSDPATFATAAALALATTVTGSLLPALRASRVDPTVALREE